MEKQKCVFFFLIIALMILFLISFATKGAHWDQVNDKNAFENYYPDVYRSMEGVIAMDVLTIVLCAAILFVYNSNNGKHIKIIACLLILFLFVRFILSVIFLAGNDEYCKKKIEIWDNLSQSLKDLMPATNFYTTMKGAWVFEIIAIISVNIVGAVAVFQLMQKGKQN